MTAETRQPIAEDTGFVQFWNEVLAPRLIRFKHVLVDGVIQHSEAVFPTLPVRDGDRAPDVGCGFGDTAIMLAEQSGRIKVERERINAEVDLARCRGSGGGQPEPAGRGAAGSGRT